MNKTIKNKIYINALLMSKVFSRDNNLLNIKLKYLARIIKEKRILIISILIATMTICGGLCYLFSLNKYEAKASLIIDSQVDNIDCKRNSIDILGKTVKDLDLKSKSSDLLDNVQVSDNDGKKYMLITMQGKDPVATVNVINRVAFNLQSGLSQIYIGRTIIIDRIAQSSVNLVKLKVIWSIVLGFIIGIIINLFLVMKDYFNRFLDTPVYE